MTIVIRPGTEHDIDDIAVVLVDTWRSAFRGRVNDAFLDGMTYAHQAERHRRTFPRPQVDYVVACDADDEVIGFVSGGPVRHPVEDYDGEIYALYVLEAHQGRGIGARLVTALAQSLLGHGLRSMLVWVLANNPDAPFYERMGARCLLAQPIQLGSEEAVQVAHVWDDLAERFG